MNILLVMLALNAGVLDCEVTAVNQDVITLCGATTLYIPLTEWPALRAWGSKQPVVGLRLKAEREGGRLRAIPDCQSRTEAAIKNYCGGVYCKPPINSLTPDDCR